MKRENLQLLISLIKLKKLHISEMKKLYGEKNNTEIDDVHAPMIQNQKTEIRILTGIIKSEEKNNGTR